MLEANGILSPDDRTRIARDFEKIASYYFISTDDCAIKANVPITAFFWWVNKNSTSILGRSMEQNFITCECGYADVFLFKKYSLLSRHAELQALPSPNDRTRILRDLVKKTLQI